MEVDTSTRQKHLVEEPLNDESYCGKITDLKSLLNEKSTILSTIYYDNIESLYPGNIPVLPIYLSHEIEPDWSTPMNIDSSPEDEFSDFGLKTNTSGDDSHKDNEMKYSQINNGPGFKNEVNTVDENSQYRTTSTDVTRNDNFFSWSNVRVNFDRMKGSDECVSDAVSGTESDPSVCNSGVKRKFEENSENNVDYENNNCGDHGNKKVAYDEEPAPRMPPWQVDSIDDMTAELDGSLSGLGVDLAQNTYTMSETLLSLPSLTVFKQEAPSPSTDNLLQANQNVNDNTIQRYLPFTGGNTTTDTNVMNNTLCKKSNEVLVKKVDEHRFQYILAAATSIATKVTEEPLTYLNQGQSYEIKLKKVGELLSFRGKLLKSVIRLCFHERRMQYMEREQILQWQASRPGERILELDLPLSYNVMEVDQDKNMINTISFLWDPTKEVGASIKVNCISTEFTPKKHGGEKGVPFRIQVETYFQEDSARLHAGACQIKVFKLKGADRKHKQDREKIQKRSHLEQDKYQPAYECTVLNDLTPDQVFPPLAPLPAPSQSPRLNAIENNNLLSPVNLQAQAHNQPVPSVSNVRTQCSDVIGETSRSPNLPCVEQACDQIQTLSVETSPQQVTLWLQKNSFDNYVSTFANFSGADLLRLTRDDFIQICGLPDGIRLFYALHSKAIVRLTIYICMPCSAVYHAIYLDNIGRNEMCKKLAILLGIQNQGFDIYLLGPNGIHVMVTDEVVNNIKDEAMFAIEVMKDNDGEGFCLLLKPTS